MPNFRNLNLNLFIEQETIVIGKLTNNHLFNQLARS